MSFFDDEDDAIEEEPRRSPRAAGTVRPRGGSGGSRPTGRGGGGAGPRRPGADPAVERRRWVAGGVLVVVIILVILLISSCQARSTKNSLKDYNNSVFRLISDSDGTGSQVFSILSSGKGGTTISQQLTTPLSNASSELSSAKGLSVPGQMAKAQTNLVLALQMRYDGINTIAHNVSQISASGTGNDQALKNIATGTARFYASDVVYKAYVVEEIAGALHGDNIAVGGDSNIQINGGQFLTELGWLVPSFIATKLGTTDTSGSSGSSATGRNTTGPGQIHGSQLTSVAVGSTTLQPAGVTNTVAGSPAPTFTLSVLDSGKYNQYNVGCSVSVSGGPSGKASIPETTQGNTSTCNVTLGSTVTPGTYDVTVTVGKVLGETNLANNTETYSVDFQ